MSKSNILQVNERQWREAQDFELHFAQQYRTADAYSGRWWKAAFGGYRTLKGGQFPNVLEVGCGPHPNLRFILPLIRFASLWLEDSLIDEYLRLKQEYRVLRYLRLERPTAVVDLASRYGARLLSDKLEDLPLPDKSIDLCVCINVLDHVQHAVRCLEQMCRVLSDGGVLAIGQDLSNEEDARRCPESWKDVGHPIKIDEQVLDSELGQLQPLYRKILPREQGRNPRCHYGTYLLIGQKAAARGQAGRE